MCEKVVHSEISDQGGIVWPGAVLLDWVVGIPKWPGNGCGKAVGDLGRKLGVNRERDRALVQEPLSIELEADRCRWGWLGIRFSRLEPYMWGLMKGWDTRYCVWARRPVGPDTRLFHSKAATPSSGGSCRAIVASPSPGPCSPPEVLLCA